MRTLIPVGLAIFTLFAAQPLLLGQDALDELERLINKLQLKNTDPHAEKEIEKSFDRLINKLLHPPLASLRDDAAEGHRRGLLEALRHLFNLGDE